MFTKEELSITSRDWRDQQGLVHPGPMLHEKADNVKYEAFTGLDAKPSKQTIAELMKKINLQLTIKH